MRSYYFPKSVNAWEQTLLQAGAGLRVYIDTPYQRGQGIGSFFRGLFRTIWRNDKKVGMEVGKEALRTGPEVATDYLREGKNPNLALKRRARQAAGRILSKIGEQMQREGLGVRPFQKSIKGIRKRRLLAVANSGKRWRKLDIYDG